jgi:hypothetical protein
MNEQALKDSYDVFVSNGYTKSFEEYKKLINSNPQALKDSYDVFVSNGYSKSIDEYKALMGVGAQPAPAPVVKKKDSLVSATPQQQPKPTTASSLASGSLATPATKKKTPKEEEEDYFTGGFGNVLRGFDNIVPLGIGDFVDDMARSVASGYRQGDVAQTANDLLLKGHKSTPEQIKKFIDANKSAQQLKPSAEMESYNKIYQEEGKGFWGVVKGLANNPSIIPEVLTSSLISMVTNTDALKAAGGAIGTGAAGGAIAGAIATPEFAGAGAIPGAISGAQSAIPYAFGLASSVVEAGSTFGELLNEELKGKELSKENVRAILEDPEKLQSIRNKAIARGVIIGTVDALTGKLASGVGAKILSKSAAKSAVGVATKQAVTKSVAAGSLIESLGGSAGEAAARAATGQDMDVSEIALEGLAELPGGVRSTIQARLAKPSYKVNGEKVKAEDIDELINTMTPAQLAATKIDIKNDYEGREFKIRDKVLTNSVKEEVKKANPNLNEPSLNAITELEKELQNLEGNKTQTGKDKAAAIRAQIKNIQENQLQEEVVAETVIAETPELAQKRTERISEIESILANDDTAFAEKGERPLLAEARTELQTELETLKSKQDAIQKQTTDESVLRTEQPELELQGVGEGNAKPKRLTAEETIINEKPEEEITPSLKVSEALNEPSGVFVYDGKKGQLKTIGKTLVLETPMEVIDIAYDLDNISDTPLEKLGVSKEEELSFKLNDDNSIELNGKKYVNNYSNPESAISQDKDGNYTVTLETENGQKRTFRGQQADQIVYETRLKNFEQNGTERQIEDAHAAADEAIRIETEARESSPKREGKSVRKGKQRILKAAEGSPTMPEGFDIVTEPTTVAEVTTETAPAKAKAEVAPVEELKELLNLDTKDKTNLQKVSDYLERLDRSLDLDPNELNDVTRVMAIGTAKAVIKTLKALVNAGITLQEAINTAAENHSVDPKDVLNAFDVINQNDKQKSAPSPVRSEIYVGDGRLVSVVKDIKKITMTEKALLVKQIRDKIRGAKDAIKTTKEISQQLVKEIKELESSGKITPTQSLNMISKFSKVNMLNEVSVSNFVDYMAKVFADADYDNKINVAKSKLKTAKKNINTKIGIADGLIGPLQRLLSVNPSLIPIKNLERYIEIVDMFSERKAVLTLEEKSKLINDVNDILDEINNERSAVDELSQRFNYSENQVIEDGKLNYAATVKNMLKEGEITEEEAELMSKYKSEIIPQVEKTQATDAEIQQEKDDLLKEIGKLSINSDELPTRIERDAAKKLASLLKTPAVKELTNAQLKNLLKVIDNINNGYFTHSAQLIIEELNSNNNKKSLVSSVNRAILLPLSKLYAKAKSILTRKDAVLEMIRRNPLFNIDQVFGDFKTKDIFNSILEKAAEGEAKFTAELKAIQLKLANAEEKIAKSHSLNPDATLMAKFKMMTYMVQLEYNSNPDSKQVNPAAEFLKATINHIDEGNSQFGEKDAEMLQEILDKFAPNGEIDIDELYNSFNSAEKAGIKTIQEVNQSLTEKAEYTASVIRGQRINPLSNYIHLNVLSDTKPNDLQSGESFATQYNKTLQPSTKAKSLIERTGEVSPINFDVFASAQKGAKFVLMDFNLTEPIRTARKTINKAITELKKEGRISSDKRKIINAIKNSFEEAVEGLVQNSYMETSIGDDVVDYIKKQGYRSVLAGTGRFVAEFLSNVGFVIVSDPTTFAEGLKYTPILMSPDAPLIMHNVNSKEINRIFPSDTLSGRLIDTNILSQANGIRGGKAKNKVVNKAQQIWNLTGKKYKNAVELTADVLITTPDKAIMRPIWFGAFAANFKKQTGQDIDFEKIAANDEAYMNQNREAIDKAKDAADERSVITGASNNTFTGILKGTSKSNQNKIISPFISGFNNFNNFMSRFLIYEYTSARTGIMAAIGNGSLSRRQGIALLGAVTTRMTVYSLLSKALGSGLIGLLFENDDDEEKKSLDKSIGQALTSSFTSMLFNRDFGNSTKTLINYGLERINENYLKALREGDYDPYKDAIQYTAVPIEKKGKQTGIYDYIENVSGAFGPAIKTTNLIIKTYSGGDKKEADAIQRQEDVKNIRIPLEVLGNAGFIPLYKDIRKTVMNNIYKDLKNPPVSTASYEEYKKSESKKEVKEKESDFGSKNKIGSKSKFGSKKFGGN